MSKKGAASLRELLYSCHESWTNIAEQSKVEKGKKCGLLYLNKYKKMCIFIHILQLIVAANAVQPVVPRLLVINKTIS